MLSFISTFLLPSRGEHSPGSVLRNRDIITIVKMARGVLRLFCFLTVCMSLASCQLNINNLINRLGNNLPNLNLTGLPPSVNQFINSGVRELNSLLRRNFNFQDIARGLKLLINGKQLNTAGFTLDLLDLTVIKDLLHGFSLEERVKVWGLMSKFINLFSANLKEFDISSLNFFEGDIVLTLEDIERIIADAEEALKVSVLGTIPSRRKRKVVTKRPEKWDKVINWYQDSVFNSAQTGMIQDALNYWERETCLTFIKHGSKPAGPHILFSQGKSCSSLIGKKPGGQDISLDDGCFEFGTVVHEIGHALGMWHEQSRPDRDLYVEVIKQNIEDGKIAQFQKRSWSHTDTLTVPYDYGSVMHYGPTFFSSSNSLPTLRAKSVGYEQTMGQTLRASFQDIKVVNYHLCNDECGGRSLDGGNCYHEGYKNPRNCNECKCPDAFKPPDCTSIKEHTIASCAPNELRALARWSSMTSPGYPGLSQKGECFWRITASPGSRVELEFMDEFELPSSHKEPCKDYIEVRYKDLSLTGPRYCGRSKPFDKFVSETEALVLLFRKKTNSINMRGFKIRYRSVGCGGCEKGAPNSQPACAETYRYTCSGKFACNWLGRKFCYRANTCLKTVYTCCPGYRKTGQTCTKI